MCFSQIVVLCLLITTALSSLSVNDINELRKELRSEFDEESGLLATIVRLIFHDCSGPGKAGSAAVAQCNGCIDFQNEDHAGLQRLGVRPLNDLYLGSGWDHKMSRADFWAAAATAALEYSQLKDDDHPGDELRTIPYYFGRTDCSSNSADAKDTRNFPSFANGLAELSTWFEETLGYNERQMTALMGLHTLGQAHKWATGFPSRPFVANNKILDNQYYKDLAIPWISVPTLPFARKWYWSNINVFSKRLMFNVDMCLWFDVDANRIVEENGFSRTVGTLFSVSSVRHIAQEYIDSNQLWLDDMADVFEMLVQTGWDNLESVNAGNGRSLVHKEETKKCFLWFCFGAQSEDAEVDAGDEFVRNFVGEEEEESESDWMVYAVSGLLVVNLGILGVVVYKRNKSVPNF